jgi:type II secretory pathway component PulJ
MTRRRGYSLFELLIVIAAASTVLTTSAVLVHRTLQMAAKTRSFHAEEATAWRLAGLLRADAADAEAIDLNVTEAEAGLSLTVQNANSQPILYRFSGPQVERSQQLDGDRVARESFVLPSVASWTGETLKGADAVQIEATPASVASRPSAPVPVSLVLRAAGEIRE